MKHKLTIVVLILLGITGLIYTDDLEQKNKETLFLTEKGAESYNNFQKNFHEKSMIVLKKDYLSHVTPGDKLKFEEKVNHLRHLCAASCDILSEKYLEKIYKGKKNQLFKLLGENYLALVLVGHENGEKLKTIIKAIEKEAYWGIIGKQVHLAGVPFTNSLLDKYSKSIKQTLFPMLFFGVFLFIFLFTGKLKTSLILFYPCVLSASLALSVTKIFLGETNLINSIVPLLMFVINLSVVLHIYYTALELKSIIKALNDKLKPIMLMICTTVIGFLSLYLSDLSAIKSFGVYTGGLIILTCTLSVLWILSCSKAFNLTLGQENWLLNLKLLNYFKKFYSYKYIFLISLICILTGVFALKKIPIITDATKYFPKSSGLRESIQSVGKTVIGSPVVDIIIESDTDFNLQQLKSIEKIEQSIIDKNPNMSLLSLNKIVSEINLSYSGNKRIPDHMISYATLRGQIPEVIKAGFPIGKSYKITLLSTPTNVDEYEKLLQKIKTSFVGSPFIPHFNGLYFHLMTAQKEMIITLFKSFLISLVVISFIAFIFFKTPRLFFIFLVVNIVPVFGSFSLLLLFGISFNIATVMTYSISLGLIVDSSFHIIHALEKKDLTYNYFLKTVIVPVLQGSLLLSTCFFMFAFNDFLPIQQFGISLGIIILLGMIFDLKVLPTLFMKTHNIFQKK